MTNEVFDDADVQSRVAIYTERLICRHCRHWKHNSSENYSVCSNLQCTECRLQGSLKPDELKCMKLYKLGEELRGLPTASVVLRADYLVHPEANRSATGGGRYFRLSTDQTSVYRCVERFDISMAAKRRREVYSGTVAGVVARHTTSVKGFGRFICVSGRRLTHAPESDASSG